VSERLTISLGVAAMPDCTPASEEDLVRLADEALYAAKHNGRKRAVAAPPAITSGP
jgi:two-component system cell cycle response regulator